ncbi:MAG TPA: undecaprenyldiphospho-muramoylpentapeptide beta-N-acetylglucosaminyltransferase [Phnomibacter sp.]|nr:undecaprenyldiphospho-muramoylpentapeptide beta-N-acetylglucosaminyltransferase [Phnomibacter sp.]
MRSVRIIIAGGGTGGHIFPAIAVANAIKQQQPSAEILFVGAKGKMEMEKVPQAGYAIKGLDIAGFNRSHWWKNILLPFKLVKSFLQVRSIFSSFKPDAAFGVGGYSSYPVLKYAQVKKLPTFLHESNAFAGKANMMLGKKASSVFVATEGMEKFFPADKLIVSGNPVRKQIAENKHNAWEAKQAFGLDNTKPALLVIGGSLGARTINEAVCAGLEKIVNSGWHLIWQTGKPFAETAQQAVANKTGIWQNDFITAMDQAYAAADMIISRSGAMSVAEICMAAKPVVFVPFPFAAEDHQTANAMALVQHDAALLVKDAAAAKDLVDTVVELGKNTSLQQTMKEKLAALAKYDADAVIAKKILETIN